MLALLALLALLANTSHYVAFKCLRGRGSRYNMSPPLLTDDAHLITPWQSPIKPSRCRHTRVPSATSIYLFLIDVWRSLPVAC